ncbi:MAG: hypothetical protein JWO25_3671 [Alphaproteobacteria bacterium]|nr:hypothetical protein [Alphaproteobacteria bacterium]
MAQGAAQGATPTGDPALFDRAHKQLLADGDIQFDLPPVHFEKPPAWIAALGRFLDGIAPGLQILFWIAMAALVLALLYGLYRWFEGRSLGWPWRRGAKAEETIGDWRPEEAPARALLGEADGLAAAGQYGAAARLLLQRSIEEIDRNRPALVRPALTSRDIADAPALPEAPRCAFARIVMAVETSLFGGRALDATAWSDCRSAYETFAFSPEWQR